MKVLLDTCAFIWLVTDDSKLSSLAKEIFLDTDNELLILVILISMYCTMNELVRVLGVDKMRHLFFGPMPLLIMEDECKRSDDE